MSAIALTTRRTEYAWPPKNRRPRAAEPTRGLKTLREKWARSGSFHGGSIETPAKAYGATWQAGVTEDNDRFKVLLDGEPQPDAIAASDEDGWVDVQVFRVDEDGPFGRTVVRRNGRVQIVPGDRV